MQGAEPDNRWRRQIPVDIPFELGRTTRPWSVPWDSSISRRHIKLRLEDSQLIVEKIPESTNPVFFQGAEKDNFQLVVGEHFVIGRTTFSLIEQDAFVTQNVPNPISQKTFTNEFLRNVHYRDAGRRIDVLNQLPSAISSAGNDDDLMMRMVNLLLGGISSASAVGIIQRTDRDQTEILHWDHQPNKTVSFQPSEGLIKQATDSGESVLHIWSSFDSPNANFTVDYENDWAFVCPLVGSACSGWGIYVSGKNRGTGPLTDKESDQSDLQGDIKFTELIGATLANVLQVQQLERRQSSLRQFFSPVVMNAFTDQDPEEVLAPRKCEVNVLFCDLRGFSTASEAMADNLLNLLSRVSGALGIMTRNILDLGGVVGDFHGDAAMGFWGWPLEQPISAVNSCRTALAIAREFSFIAQQPNHELSNFKIGIGLASGAAVAGKIGTSDQVKVTVFGPVVNLASRLEGLTKTFGASILLDQATFEKIESHVVDGQPEFAIRRVANIQPYGMKTATNIYELLVDETMYSQEHLMTYQQGLAAFERGDWEAAMVLGQCKDDLAASYLLSIIHTNSNSAPTNWTGIIYATSK